MDQPMVTYKTGKNTYKIFCNELRSRYTLYKMNGNKKEKITSSATPVRFYDVIEKLEGENDET